MRVDALGWRIDILSDGVMREKRIVLRSALVYAKAV
jgi:hypothetical protein